MTGPAPSGIPEGAAPGRGGLQGGDQERTQSRPNSTNRFLGVWTESEKPPKYHFCNPLLKVCGFAMGDLCQVPPQSSRGKPCETYGSIYVISVFSWLQSSVTLS